MGCAEGEGAGFEDAGPESSLAFEEVFHSGGEDLVHPVAGGTFDGAVEVGVTDAKFFFDEGVEVDALGEDVAAEYFGWAVVALKGVLGGLKDGDVKEGDLAFEVFFVVVKAIAYDAFASFTFDGLGFVDGVGAGWFSVVAFEVVARGCVDFEDFDLHGGRCLVLCAWFLVLGSWFRRGCKMMGLDGLEGPSYLKAF